MSDKISESLWKAFTRKQKLDTEIDDKELLKALARLDKTDVGRPEPRVQALDDVVEQGKKQMVALAKAKRDLETRLGAKTFSAAKTELDDLIETAEKLLKQARDAQQQSQSDQEEADSPALLTTKMLPLIRELRKGEATMQSLVAMAGKETVVLISRRAISPARGKLLKEQMTNPSGLKFVRGTCLFEQGALTFVVQAPAGGLARKIKTALFAQTELRLKVRVRGENADDVEEDGEVDEAEGELQAADRTSTSPTAASDAPAAPALPSESMYAARLTALMPGVKQAAERGSADAAKHARLLEFAAGKATAKDFIAALAALKQVELLLAAAVPEPPRGGVEAGTAFKARLTALIPRIKEAQTSGHPAAQDVKLKASEAGVLAGKKDFDRAQQLLDEVEELLLANPAAPADRPTATAVGPAALTERLRAAETELQALGSSGDPALQPAYQALQAAQAGRAGATGPALLDRLEALIGTARSAARGREAARDNARGIAWPKLLLRWREAQSQARGAVEGLGRAILDMPEVQGDPRFETVKLAVDRLPALIPDLGATLGDLLDEGLNAGTDAGIAERARSVVADYRQRLAGATALDRLERFATAHVGELQVLRTLDGALAEIASSLE